MRKRVEFVVICHVSSIIAQNNSKAVGLFGLFGFGCLKSDAGRNFFDGTPAEGSNGIFGINGMGRQGRGGLAEERDTFLLVPKVWERGATTGTPATPRFITTSRGTILPFFSMSHNACGYSESRSLTPYGLRWAGLFFCLLALGMVQTGSFCWPEEYLSE
jgi:hypothetical protein